MQYSDDTARGLPALWLGWKGWRHFWDATFTQWGIAAISYIVALALLAVVIPSALAVAALAWVASSLVRYANSEAPPWWRWGLFGLWLSFFALLSSSPLAWITPLPIPLAVLFALGPAIYIPRRGGRKVDTERPFRYWFGLLGRIAAGPRPDAPAAVDPSALALLPDQPVRIRKIKPRPVTT